MEDLKAYRIYFENGKEGVRLLPVERVIKEESVSEEIWKALQLLVQETEKEQDYDQQSKEQ